MLMVNTMYRNKSGKGDYQKKTAQLVVKQKSGKEYKTVGQVEVNLADYVIFRLYLVVPILYFYVLTALIRARLLFVALEFV
jgi:hypothetical protein